MTSAAGLPPRRVLISAETHAGGGAETCRRAVRSVFHTRFKLIPACSRPRAGRFRALRRGGEADHARPLAAP